MLRRTFLSSVLLAVRRERLAEAEALIRREVDRGSVHAAALRVDYRDGSFSQGYGAARPDTVFLIASISKPMTAAGVMKLCDERMISLDDPVQRFFPEFHGHGRERITLRHLLTHTSGLPDMLPENIELRKRHAPLEEFVARTLRTPLLFAPGSHVRYQSMGILLAAAIAEKVTGRPFRDFLAKEVFLPLGMKATSLGLGGRPLQDTAQCQVAEPSDWDWNSPYWRDLGAPWGGVHSTCTDIARFLDAFLRPNGRVLRVETARQMVANQTAPLPEPWGLGWMVKPGAFGKACSGRTFGHWGATGTVAWADPETMTRCVLLTSKPADQSRAGLLGPVSDLVSQAVAAV